MTTAAAMTKRIFQSTPPARGATLRDGRTSRPPQKFQSTPPARGATRPGSPAASEYCISIHAPREGGDATALAIMFAQIQFQSTPPARGATTLEYLAT